MYRIGVAVAIGWLCAVAWVISRDDAAAHRALPVSGAFRVFAPALAADSAAPPISFGAGVLRVGVDIPAGTYRTRSAPSAGSCYWERLSGFGGTLGEIISNELPDGPWVVTIAQTDRGFSSTRCPTWTQDLSAITASPTAPFAAGGVYIVGTDISAGTWRSDGAGSCYWQRLTGFGGTLGEIIANDFGAGPALVTISISDRGFSSSLGCGSWTRQ